MSKYIMALDSGTTSTRCILFDKEGRIKTIAQKDIIQYFPKSGWVEHDANEIWAKQLGCIIEALSKVEATAKDIDSIGITNQRETTILWNTETGEPIHNAIVWQCRRTSEYCDELRNIDGMTEKIRNKTGLVIDAYFSATKIKWLLDNVKGARKLASENKLAFGTVETWLIWKLTNGKVHITDYSNASRTMLYNIVDLKWDEDILKILNIPRNILPEVKESSCIYGKTDIGYLEDIIISGAAGDQQAALFGQTCFKPGDTKNTYGTGAFVLMNTGNKPVFSENGLVTTIAWGIDGKINYALEGSIFVAGSAIQWLRDELRIIDSAEDTEYMAQQVDSTNGCYMVPAFTGLGAPHWDQYARGTIVGITRGVNKKHIVRATLESIAFQTYDVIDLMLKESKENLRSLKVDGGASLNNFLMQFQSDIINIPVIRPEIMETTALGVAYLAGLATGFWKDEDEIVRKWYLSKKYKPNMKEEERKRKIQNWNKAIERSFNWAEE